MGQCKKTTCCLRPGITFAETWSKTSLRDIVLCCESLRLMDDMKFIGIKWGLPCKYENMCMVSITANKEKKNNNAKEMS